MKFLFISINLFLISLPLFATPTNDIIYDFLDDRYGQQATSWATEQSDLTAKKISQMKTYSFNKKTAIEAGQYSANTKAGEIKNGNIYFLEGDKYLSQSIEDYKSEKKPILILSAYDLKLSGTVVFELIRCLPANPNKCLLSYSQNDKRTFIVEVDLKTKSIVNNGFNITVDGNNRAEWIDENTLLIGAPNLTPESSTTDLSAREVRVWQRGQNIIDSKIILTCEKNDGGFFIWSLESAHTKVNYISQWFANGGGATYVFNSNETGLIQVNHPTSMNSFHAFYQNNMIIQIYEDWREFKFGDIISVNLNKDDPKLLLRPNTVGIWDIVTSGNKTWVMTVANGKLNLSEAELQNNAWLIKPVASINKHAGQRVVATDYHSDSIIIKEESYLVPPQLILYEKNKINVLRKSSSFFDETKFTTNRIYAPSTDGAQVPYYLVGENLAQNKRKRPVIIYAYGSFGLSLLPTYRPLLGKAWLEKGGIYVEAHVRGGGELGPVWETEGTGPKKQNSFTDLQAVAEDLIKRGITEPGMIGIMGGSAGGLLVAGSMAQRPDLFGAVISTYGIIDIFKLDGNHAANYGDINDPVQCKMVQNYSPMYRLNPNVKYPALMLLTSTTDERVHPLHSRRLAAKMNSQGHSEVYYHERTEGAHSDINEEQWAMIYTFFNDKLNRKPPSH